MQPPPDIIAKAEEQHGASMNPSHNAPRYVYHPNHHALPPLAKNASDMTRIEILDESPAQNSRTPDPLHGRSRIPTPEPRTESCNVHPLNPEPLVYHAFSIHVLSLLMSFSVFGTLARLGIHALATYDGQSIFPLAWVQAVGCGIMGFALGLRDPIIQFYGPLYTAITTGFCGSLTTFSGWQFDVFQAWANISDFHRIWIYDAVDGFTRILFTLAASLASFGLGLHLATRVAPWVPILSPPTPLTRWIVSIVSITLYILTIPLFVRLHLSWRHLVTAALVFSFPGTLTRYVLSTYLNPRSKALPLGTLVANEFATALLAACHIIQRAPSSPSPVACSILQGFIDGYCGCLSTVSTFAAEVRTLTGPKAWTYATISIGLGQVILLVMLGPGWWTGRIKEGNLCRFE